MKSGSAAYAAMKKLFCMYMAESDTIDMSLAGDAEWLPWYVGDGVAYAEGYIMTILEDDRLCIEEDDMQMIFGYDADAVVPELPGASPAAPAAARLNLLKMQAMLRWAWISLR